jgi:prepilin-type N-terminal cleavage/methylation domain-containing protein
MRGGCITISSLGGIGGKSFTPIVNAPEVAILGVTRSEMKQKGFTLVEILIVMAILSVISLISYSALTTTCVINPLGSILMVSTSEPTATEPNSNIGNILFGSQALLQNTVLDSR